MVSFEGDLRSILAEAGVATVLIGAHAANVYRLDVRLTSDVDLLTITMGRAVEALEDAGCQVRAIADGETVYLVTARRGSERVDLLLAETDYQRQAYERAENGVLRPEDVIVHKLIAGRPRDLDDIASILANPAVTIDADYVGEHAAEWGVSERWDAFRR